MQTKKRNCRYQAAVPFAFFDYAFLRFIRVIKPTAEIISIAIQAVTDDLSPVAGILTLTIVSPWLAYSTSVPSDFV